MHAALSCVAGAILTFIWAITGFGFWLFWPLFGLAAALVLQRADDELVARAAPGARARADASASTS